MILKDDSSISQVLVRKDKISFFNVSHFILYFQNF